MDMLMLVFRTSLKERVHELLRVSGVKAYTEIPETVGMGQSGSTEGARSIPEEIVCSSSRSNQFSVTRSLMRSWPGVQRHSKLDGLNQPFGYSLGPAHSLYSNGCFL